MATLMDSLERVWLELLKTWVAHQRIAAPTREDDARAELAWDLMNDLERFWPDRILEIRQRHQ